MKKVGILPLMAFGLGLGLVVSQSAFTKVADPLYPKVGTTYQSTPLDLSKEGQSGGWRCANAQADCAAEFSSPPSSTNQIPTGAIKPGQFTSIP
nr:hypothetical protein [Pedobacter panaciterrae]